MPVLPRLFKRSSVVPTQTTTTNTSLETGLLQEQPQYYQPDDASVKTSAEKSAMIHPSAAHFANNHPIPDPFPERSRIRTSQDDDIERILVASLHPSDAAFSQIAGIVRTVSIRQTEG